MSSVHVGVEDDAYSTHNMSCFNCFCRVAFKYNSIAVDVEFVFSKSPGFL